MMCTYIHIHIIAIMRSTIANYLAPLSDSMSSGPQGHMQSAVGCSKPVLNVLG